MSDKHLDLPEVTEMPLEVKNLGEMFIGGFRINWLNGTHETEHGTMRYDLDSGAGMGSSALTFGLHYRGRYVQATANIQPLFEAWIKQARAAIDAAEDAEKEEPGDGPVE